MTHIRSMSAVALGCAAILLSGCATTPETDYWVEEGDFPPKTAEDPVVGTRIGSTNDAENGAKPVRVYSREEMRKNGSRSVGGFLGGN